MDAVDKGNRGSRPGILFGVLFQQFINCPGSGIFDEHRRVLAGHGWGIERDHDHQRRWHLHMSIISYGVHRQYSFSRRKRNDSRNVEHYRRAYHAENHRREKRAFGEQDHFKQDRVVQQRRTCFEIRSWRDLAFQASERSLIQRLQEDESGRNENSESRISMDWETWFGTMDGFGNH